MPSAEVLACCRCWRGESRRSREVHYGAKIVSLTGCSTTKSKWNWENDGVLLKRGNQIKCKAPTKLTASVVQNKACRECSCLICPAGFINLCLWNTNHGGNILCYRLHVYTCNLVFLMQHEFSPENGMLFLRFWERKHIYFWFILSVNNLQMSSNN